MGLFGSKRLREKKKKIIGKTNWSSGSILGGDFDKTLKKLDKIDEKIRKKETRKNKRGRKSGSYGVHREHGWYLPNDD